MNNPQTVEEIVREEYEDTMGEYELALILTNDRLAHKTAVLEAVEGQREPATSQEEFEEKWLDVVITRANFIEFTRDAKKISRQITLDTMTAIINKIYE